MTSDRWCPTCRIQHGDDAEPHPYEPDRRRPVDPITGQRPCRECGRFKGSYLHPKELSHA